jgi:hypothetical protein
MSNRLRGGLEALLQLLVLVWRGLLWLLVLLKLLKPYIEVLLKFVKLAEDVQDLRSRRGKR